MLPHFLTATPNIRITNFVNCKDIQVLVPALLPIVNYARRNIIVTPVSVHNQQNQICNYAEIV